MRVTASKGVLRRATVAPQLDFIVLPLIQARVPEFEMAIRSKTAFTGYRGIIHVQIEAKGQIVFGAFDNFGRETVVVSEIISTELLDNLVREGKLRGYSPISKARID